MSKPNLLLVSIDSLRADCVSALDGCGKTTPEFDTLAEDGALFENAFAPASWTLPSHASIFTGLYPSEHGILSGDVRLGEHPTFAELFSEAGYDTRAFYRLDWLGAGDVLRGFESTDTSVDSSTAGSSHLKNRIGDTLGAVSEDLKQFVRGVYRGTFRGPMPDERTVENSITALAETASPFCFFVHLNDAHWPYSPAARYHDQYTNRSWTELFWNRAYTQRKLYNQEKKDYRPSSEEASVMKELYLGCVRQTDSHLGRLIKALKQLDLFKDTVIVVFGDHGEAFGEAGRFGHGEYPSPEIAHVPLVVRDPTGTVTRGRVDEPVQLNDLYPTLAEIVDVEPPSTRSVSIANKKRDFAFTHTSDTENAGSPRFFAVWKTAKNYLVWDARRENIDTTAGSPPEANVLEHHRSQLQAVEPLTDASLDDEAVSNLRQLGYLQ